MTPKLHPYLHFLGTAREALEFYRSVFGGEVTISTFDEYGGTPDPKDAKKVMHGFLRGGNAIEMMAADTPAGMESQPGGTITLSLSGEDEAALRGYYEKLIDGGVVEVPLEQSPWGDIFGMLTDRFGIGWMVNITTPKNAAA